MRDCYLLQLNQEIPGASSTEIHFVVYLFHITTTGLLKPHISGCF